MKLFNLIIICVYLSQDKNDGANEIVDTIK